jgi:8-oxo-dGTP diphosphatase
VSIKSNDIAGMFSDRVRIRVCGLLVKGEELLLVKLDAPTHETPFWSPPGGGLKLGESLENALVREFVEETGLHVEPIRLFYISEFIQPPFHAVEFYFLCKYVAGDLVIGTDPELMNHTQMIMDIRYFGLSDISKADVFPTFIRDRFHQDYTSHTNTPIWIRSGEP